MKISMCLLLLTAFASSCAFPSPYTRNSMFYVGRFYPPSYNLDVVYDERDLKTTRVEFIGEIAWGGILFQRDGYALLERELIDEAKSRGADAMIVSVIYLHDSSFVRHSVRVRLVKYIP
jgi:hypothetical protein